MGTLVNTDCQPCLRAYEAGVNLRLEKSSELGYNPAVSRTHCLILGKTFNFSDSPCSSLGRMKGLTKARQT